ncbi:MAG: hypothetical protein PWQ16_465 [bacterium]|nr:hypothetical protein [bacterium]
MFENCLVIVLVAILTYLSRLLPFYFKDMLKRLSNVDEFSKESSASLMSALFVTSLVSFPLNVKGLASSLIALFFVFLSYIRWNNLGISVLIGVLVHWLLSVI